MTMANPQLENGYTKIANEILEALSKINLTSYQSRLLFVIFRKTYGFNKSEDWISNSQLVAETGLLKGNVSRTKKELIARKIVISIDNKIKFNKDCSQWRELSNQITVIKRDNGVINSDKKVISLEGHKRNITKETIQKKIMSDFEIFYKAYPLKKGRGQAERAFLKVDVPVSVLLEAIEKQKKEKIVKKERKEFCPEWKHPATWLNGKCWEDEVSTENKLTGLYSNLQTI